MVQRRLTFSDFVGPARNPARAVYREGDNGAGIVSNHGVDPVLVGLSAVGATLAVAAGRSWLLRRAASAEERTPIHEGEITLFGEARSQGDLVVAPLARTECLAFEVKVYERAGYEPMGRVSGCASFSLVVDGTPITVRPEDAEIVVEAKEREVVVEPEALWAILDRIDAEASQYEGALAEECRLLPGERVYVSGQAATEPDSSRSGGDGVYRSRLPQRWVLRSNEGTVAIRWQREAAARASAAPRSEPPAFGARSRAATWMPRRGVSCPHCGRSSKRARYVDDGYSSPFLVCARCARSFEPPS